MASGSRIKVCAVVTSVLMWEKAASRVVCVSSSLSQRGGATLYIQGGCARTPREGFGGKGEEVYNTPRIM